MRIALRQRDTVAGAPSYEFRRRRRLPLAFLESQRQLAEIVHNARFAGGIGSKQPG
jgi:hypothetical protein